MNTMEKIQADKNGCKYILFRIDISFKECFQQQKLMKTDILIETLFLRKKDKKYQKKKTGCKFIRINTSNAKNGNDLDYEVGNVQTFIDELKNKKNKKTRKTINKRKRTEKETRKENERNEK